MMFVIAHHIVPDPEFVWFGVSEWKERHHTTNQPFPGQLINVIA